MEIPVSLRTAIEKHTTGRKITELKKISDEITRRYKAESTNGKRLVVAPDEALVYSIVRMPATYGAVWSALSAALQQLPDLQIETMLDVGAGTGAATFAALEIFNSIKEVTCVERETAMLSLLKRFYEEYGNAAVLKTEQADMLQFRSSQKYDLVIAAYSLNELSDADRTTALQKLWQLTGKLLLIVEPGTPTAFFMQRKNVRELTELGANLVAPCPHAGECPLPSDDWCHFICRVARTKLHRLVKGGESPFEDEKFTYIAFYQDEGELRCKNRVIRHPLVRPNGVTVKLCGSEGIRTETFTKRDKNYKQAKKLSHGDTVDF